MKWPWTDWFAARKEHRRKLKIVRAWKIAERRREIDLLETRIHENGTWWEINSGSRWCGVFSDTARWDKSGHTKRQAAIGAYNMGYRWEAKSKDYRFHSVESGVRKVR